MTSSNRVVAAVAWLYRTSAKYEIEKGGCGRMLGQRVNTGVTLCR
jgi:hypothetical protein